LETKGKYNILLIVWLFDPPQCLPQFIEVASKSCLPEKRGVFTMILNHARSFLPFFLPLSVLLLNPLQTNAQNEDRGYRNTLYKVGGEVCQVQNASNATAKKLRRINGELRNTHAENWLQVWCPIPIRTFANDFPDDPGPAFDVWVELEVRNNSSIDRTYRCTFYNIGDSGNVPLIEITETMHITAGQNQGLGHMFEEVDTFTAINGYLTVNCGLPPLSAILHLSITFSLGDLS
jgi:hypothetical protein